MKATFENSVNVLVKAFLKGTLEHTNCYACAVGNLICDANGYTYTKVEGCMQTIRLKENDGLYDGGTFGGGWHSVLHWKNNKRQIAITEIEKTGYSIDEIAQIEKAFEGAEQGDSAEDWIFNGLMQVVSALAEIHNVSLESKESAKKLFVKI